MNNPWKISIFWMICIAVSCSIVYYVFGYHLERSNFSLLLALYSGLFAAYILLFFSEFKYKFALGLFFRTILILQIPNLSQDFYRFIWDGRLMVSEINPYSFLPVDLVDKVFDAQFLIAKMGALSAHNHSNYPPLNQLIFAIGAFLSPKNLLGNVLVMKIIIILADIGVYFFGRKILEFLNLRKENIHYYFLNPLVVIELTGNLHFEGVMMFFLCLGFYFFFKSKYSFSAVFLALAILTKLIPLMLLPFFFKKIPANKLIAFYMIIGLICIVAFIPFYDEHLVSNYSKTVGLWFTNFEFNGSIYYLLREIGYWVTGYNIIAIIGKIGT
jgi:alpha-1,6-mannosyltransferase